MKGYVITFYSVDGATCENDGFINCANGGLCRPTICKTIEEAKELRKQIVEQDLADFEDSWNEENGYTKEVGDMNDYDGHIADTYLDVYYDGDVVNETIYRIEEVKL